MTIKTFLLWGLTVFFSGISCVFAVEASGQIRFSHFAADNGLSQNSATSILRDDNGFIWVGTRDGLNRFDGYEFKVFRHKSHDGSTLSDNHVRALFKDRQGILWIGTAKGLNRYDAKTESFIRFVRQSSVSQSLSNNDVRAIVEDNEGNLWIGTADGLNVLDSARETFVHFAHDEQAPQSLSHNVVTAVLQDRDGTIWVGTEKGLNRFDGKSKTFERFNTPVSKKLTNGAHQIVNDMMNQTGFRFSPRQQYGLSDDWITALYGDSNGYLWIGTEGGGLNRFDPERKQIERLGTEFGKPPILNSSFVTYITEGPGNQIWIATWGGGLTIFDGASGQSKPLFHHKDNPYSLSDNQVFYLYRDSDDLMWVGTSSGMDLFNPDTSLFGHVYEDPSDNNSLSGQRVRAILKDSKGNVWAGTRNQGLSRFDSKTGKVQHFRHDPKVPGSLSKGQVYNLFEDSKGEIWVGTYSGLNRYDSLSGQFVHFYHYTDNPHTISSSRVTAISEDSNGNLWIGTWGGGVNRLDRLTGQFHRFTYNTKNPFSLSHNMVMTLFHDDKGVLWVGTVGGGLNRFDDEKKQFVRYLHDPASAASISGDRVFSITQMRSDELWIGTASGLNRMDTSSGSFYHYNPSDGLKNDTILAVLADKLGMLWLSTNKGLVKFDPLQERFYSYHAIDGLQNDEFSINSADIGVDGELLFGGINGFNRFYPKSIESRSTRANIVLTDLKVDNQTAAISNKTNPEAFVLSEALNELSSLVLSHNESLVTFEFSAVDFVNPKALRYAYQLTGWDKDWIYTDSNRRFATYTKLAPGDYQFKVKVANADGHWSEDIRTLPITVLPPWWASNLAKLIYLLAALGSIWGIYRIRTKGLIQRAKALEQSVLERTKTINRLMAQKDRMFANVSHEFKTPLTLILNPLDTLEQTLDKPSFDNKVGMMRRNGQRLLRMVDQLLELSRLDTAVQEAKKHYSVTQLMGLLMTSFEPLFQSKQLKVNYQPCEEAVVTTTIDALEMILSNLLSNAVKYTPAGGNIDVVLTADDAQLQVIVKDNGIGISEENLALVFNRFTRATEEHGETIPGAGIGLALVKELVETNGGTIALQSDLGKGSEFTVLLPLATEEVLEIANTARLHDAPSMVEEPATSTPGSEQDNLNTADDLPNVLVIDDNADMLELLYQTLSGSYQFRGVNNGQKGVEVANETLPDLVISDVMMPGMSGFEVLKALKESPLTSHIPVILLTAKGDAQSRILGWSEKADDYMEKPFNSVELHARVENLLFVRSLLRQKYQSDFIQEKNEVTGANEQEHLLGLPGNEADLNVVNLSFCKKIESVLEANYADEDFDVNRLASEMLMSYRQLGRKMKALLNLTPAEGIRCFRLKKAAEKLKQGFSPGDVAFAVGFTSHSYFSQCFKARFNCLPSAYR